MWGYNLAGNLGLGDVVNRSSPTQVGAGTDWAKISMSDQTNPALGHHVAAIKSDGTLWNWGFNTFGQLGDGTTDPQSSPIQVGADTDWAEVMCGWRHTNAIKTDGTLWSWGENTDGELGDNTVINRSSPVQIHGSGTNWDNFGAPGNHTREWGMAQKDDATLWQWGQNNVDKQLKELELHLVIVVLFK